MLLFLFKKEKTKPTLSLANSILREGIWFTSRKQECNPIECAAAAITELSYARVMCNCCLMRVMIQAMLAVAEGLARSPPSLPLLSPSLPSLHARTSSSFKARLYDFSLSLSILKLFGSRGNKFITLSSAREVDLPVLLMSACLRSCLFLHQSFRQCVNSFIHSLVLSAPCYPAGLPLRRLKRLRDASIPQ